MEKKQLVLWASCDQRRISKKARTEQKYVAEKFKIQTHSLVGYHTHFQDTLKHSNIGSRKPPGEDVTSGVCRQRAQETRWTEARWQNRHVGT